MVGKSVTIAMANSKSQTIYTRTFIFEANGMLLRYTERVQELTKVRNCETIDLTSDDEDLTIDLTSDDEDVGRQTTDYQRLRIACSDDRFGFFLTDGETQTNNNNEEQPPSPTQAH